MTTINNDPKSLYAQRNLAAASAAVAKNLERLSSGLRLNSASDDAASLAISTQLNASVSSYAVAQRNASDGISLAQASDAGLSTQQDLLGRLRELAMQSANGSLNASDRRAIEAERTQLTAELDRVASSTSFNGTSLLDAGPGASLSFQVGIDGNPSSSPVAVPLANTTTQALGVGQLDFSTAGGAQASLSAIDSALQSLSSTRSTLGATQNRLESAFQTAGAAGLTTAAAASRIQDTDVAAEASALVSHQILARAGVAVLAQVNKQSGYVLRLLQP